jgi:hypothetical protein
MATPIGPTTPILCPANTWTPVAYGLMTTGTYTFVANKAGITIKWRRFTSSPPFYWEGSFVSGTGTTTFFFIPWLYSELDFLPSSATSVRRF